MNVAFRLKKSETGHAALAALTLGTDPAALLELCARLGLDPHGRVFRVSGGFLVTLDTPSRAPIPGAVRLRALATNLYLPSDATLLPALLDDEAEGLTRERGLIFLPEGRVLAFEPRKPIDPATLLFANRIPRRAWSALPIPIDLPRKIEELSVDRPDETPESLFENQSFGEPIGTEEPPRPEVGSPSANLLGKAAFKVGKGLAWLGKTLKSQKLAALGTGWIEKATKLAPRLSEELLGRQTAALRNLLNQFREGDIDKALRRALPVGDPGELRGSSTFTGDRLPDVDFRYGLNEILSAAGRGTSSGIWVGQGVVMAELVREYRKAAEESLRKGDFRRAAAIYGKLLRDYRAAAQALIRGGLHHDAGVLMLAKLDDRKGAARAFEAAGELDRAVQLYREVGEHELAGDLLRRIGEEGAALEEYRIAADRLVMGTQGHLGAGRLLLNKAGRADLALAYFAAGWARRPGSNAINCAHEAAKILADKGDVQSLNPLLDEADAHFEELGNFSMAGLFYNDIVELAERPALSTAREGLRDRVLLAIAGQMRRIAQYGQNTVGVMPALLGRSGRWSASTVSDATYALAAASRRTALVPPSRERPVHPTERSAMRFRVGVGTVSATTVASDAGTVFVGFEKGEVFAFRPESAEVVEVSTYLLPVTAIATDLEGERVVILRANESGKGVLSSYLRQPDGSYRLLLGKMMQGLMNPWLTNILPGPDASGAFEGDSYVGLWNGESLELLWAGSLNTWDQIAPEGSDRPFLTALLLESEESDEGRLRLLAHDGAQWTEMFSRVTAQKSKASRPAGLRWQPSVPEHSPLRSLPMNWAHLGDDMVLVAGLGDGNSIHAAHFHRGNLIASSGMEIPEGFLAAAVVRDSLIVGVTRSRILWLKPGNRRFSIWRESNTAIPLAVAAFASRKTGELIVVCKDGFVARVRIPS